MSDAVAAADRRLSDAALRTVAATGTEPRPLGVWYLRVGRGLIVPSSRGTFERVAAFEPGAYEAELVEVIDGETLVDAVAWLCGNPAEWWIEHDAVSVLGEDELAAAWWEDRPARLLETPADVVSEGAGFCVLDWSADVNAIVGRVAEIQCASSAVYERLRYTLVRQAMPRGLTITVTG